MEGRLSIWPTSNQAYSPIGRNVTKSLVVMTSGVKEVCLCCQMASHSPTRRMPKSSNAWRYMSLMCLKQEE